MRGGVGNAVGKLSDAIWPTVVSRTQEQGQQWLSAACADCAWLSNDCEHAARDEAILR